MDRVSAAIRSRTMGRIRKRGTGPERIMETLLRRAGVRHLRRNVARLPGCPDFVIREARLTVFVDSCFWHGCRLHYRRPASRREYWDLKIQRNIERDQHVNALLSAKGWRVARYWEHEIRDEIGRTEVIAKLLEHLAAR